MEVYSLKSRWVQQTLQFTPLVLKLSLIRFHLLWGEFSAFSAAITPFTIFSNFCSTRYPSLLGGQRYERYGMRGLPNTSTHQLTSVIFGNWLIYHVLSLVWEIVGWTNCLKLAWGFVVHECPLGGTTYDAHISAAFINDSARLVQDIIHLLDLQKSPGLLR